MIEIENQGDEFEYSFHLCLLNARKLTFPLKGDLEGLTRIVSSSSGDDRSWLAVDNRGWGPLHHAAYNGHSRCVQYLGLDLLAIQNTSLINRQSLN